MLSLLPHAGWNHNARLANADVELIVTLEVGPRVISYRRLGFPAGDERGENVLKQYAEQRGGRGESEWKIRGGHRLWVAPEDEGITYALDNGPVAHEFHGENTLHLILAAAAPHWVEKRLTLTLDATGPGVTLFHEIVNRGSAPLHVAPWALTVMAPGGVGVVPQPPLGEHPRDLLPNRRLVVWPYSDLTDPRLRLGPELFTLRQTADGKPLKLGLNHAAGWAGYLLGRRFFAKTVSHDPGAVYPDDGCNFETFTNDEMLEVETLGPLRALAPGEAAAHVERWTLHAFDEAPDTTDAAALAACLAAVVPK